MTLCFLRILALTCTSSIVSAAGTMPDLSYPVDIQHPSFVGKSPRILFDESHNNVHSLDSTYRPFGDLLRGDGYSIDRTSSSFTRKSLEGYDILVVASARGAGDDTRVSLRSKPAYSEAECDRVYDWVNQGGALFAIADHYPIGPAMASMLARFNVKISGGFTRDPEHHFERESWLVFSRENKLIGEHPITSGRSKDEFINRIISFTGTSIKAPEKSTVLLKLSPTAFDFYHLTKQRVSVANQSLGVAMQEGLGKVVIIGEAAMFTAQIRIRDGSRFGMNVPGNDNRQFLLNIMHWLTMDRS